MSEDFYPFVENGNTSAGDASTLVVRHPARIAVYDDAAAAPRVVVVEPKDVRAYLEEITLQVTQLAQGQGGSIPFMVIREIVENFIHAYFMEPTISILDHGNTIRFSDQGPGIREKHRALQYGTTSATEDMRRFIRGVGSGLPYAQQYMVDKGGSLKIDDNIAGGTVVTISAVAQAPEQAPAYPVGGPYGAPQTSQPQQGWQQPYPQQGQQPYQQQPYQQQPYQQQPYQQQYPQQPAWGQPYAQPSQPTYAQPAPYQQQPAWQQGAPSQGVPSQGFPSQGAPYPAATPAQEQPSWPAITVRGRAVLDYLSQHDSVGPSDLQRTYGESQPTWTRELQALEEQGLIRKDGQKRRLTAMGRSLLNQ